MFNQMRDGVSPCRVWLPKGPWQTVHQFLCQKFTTIPADYWLERMRLGMVLWADGTVIASDEPYQPLRFALYYREFKKEAVIPFEIDILYENEHLLVIDKPHFLPTTPAGRFVRQTALTRLKQQYNNTLLSPAHRLDRETAGVILFTKTKEVRPLYQNLFMNKQIQKVYHAVAPLQNYSWPVIRHSKIVKANQGFITMCEVDGEPNSESHIQLLKALNATQGLYEIRPKTGQQHQIRVHMSALGMPILHDSFYPTLQPDKGTNYTSPLQLLAKSIAFIDPVSNLAVQYHSKRQLQWAI